MKNYWTGFLNNPYSIEIKDIYNRTWTIGAKTTNLDNLDFEWAESVTGIRIIRNTFPDKMFYF